MLSVRTVRVMTAAGLVFSACSDARSDGRSSTTAGGGGVHEVIGDLGGVPVRFTVAAAQVEATDLNYQLAVVVRSAQYAECE